MRLQQKKTIKLKTYLFAYNGQSKTALWHKPRKTDHEYPLQHPYICTFQRMIVVVTLPTMP